MYYTASFTTEELSLLLNGLDRQRSDVAQYYRGEKNTETFAQMDGDLSSLRGKLVDLLRVPPPDNGLASRLTPAFLDTLTELVKTCGDTVDHTETSAFVRWCYGQVGLEAPSLTPYKDDDP